METQVDKCFKMRNIFIFPFAYVMCFIITQPNGSFCNFFYMGIINIIIDTITKKLFLNIFFFFRM